MKMRWPCTCTPLRRYAVRRCEGRLCSPRLGVAAIISAWSPLPCATQGMKGWWTTLRILRLPDVQELAHAFSLGFPGLAARPS